MAYVSPRVLMRTRLDAILPALKLLPGLQDITIERNRGLELPAQDAPALLYYASDSQAQLVSVPGNPPRFVDTVKLTFRLWARALTIAEAEAQMDTLLDGLRNLLLTSQAFLAPPVKRFPSMDAAINVDAKEGKTLFSAVFTLDVELEDLFQPALIDPFNVLVETVAIGPAGTQTITQTQKIPMT